MTNPEIWSTVFKSTTAARVMIQPAEEAAIQAASKEVPQKRKGTRVRAAIQDRNSRDGGGVAVSRFARIPQKRGAPIFACVSTAI